jgi:hypothetical protein
VRLPFAVLGGIAAWTAHLLIGASLIGLVCPAATTLLVALHATTFTAAAVSVGAGAVALGIARRSRGWRQFLAYSGLLLDLLSFGTILLGGLTPVLVPVC